MKQTKLRDAYEFCQNMAQSHYENFPVASVLLPRKLRLPISVIYAFARTADDVADEGNASQETRLEQLDVYSKALFEIRNHGYSGTNPIFIALNNVIKTHELPIYLFNDLLSAFKQDVVKNRYANFEEVLDYCTRSANPVGRLLLHLNGNPTDKQLEQSDAICSALQLINFYQDIIQDYTEQDRIYIPQDELALAKLQEIDLLQSDTQHLAPLLNSLYQRAKDLMKDGILLGASLKGRLGWEIRAMSLGGISTLHMLTEQDNSNLLTRPRLDKKQLILIMLNSACRARYLKKANLILG
ncbi:MAG: squalene synthase HpnC [Methylophagaceae bacterium]|jgi:squalene synthase HpnC